MVGVLSARQMTKNWAGSLASFTLTCDHKHDFLRVVGGKWVGRRYTPRSAHPLGERPAFRTTTSLSEMCQKRAKSHKIKYASYLHTLLAHHLLVFFLCFCRHNTMAGNKKIVHDFSCFSCVCFRDFTSIFRRLWCNIKCTPSNTILLNYFH